LGLTQTPIAFAEETSFCSNLFHHRTVTHHFPAQHLMAVIEPDPLSIGASHPEIFLLMRKFLTEKSKAELEIYRSDNTQVLQDRILMAKRVTMDFLTSLRLLPLGRSTDKKAQVFSHQMLSTIGAYPSRAYLTPQEILRAESLTLLLEQQVQKINSASGIIAEILIRLTAPEATAHSGSYFELLKPHIIQKHGWNLDQYQQFFIEREIPNGEIDVIFKNKKAWGEVKHNQTTFDPGQWGWAALIRQLENHRKMKDLHNDFALEDHHITELHLFLNGGVSPEGAKIIQDLGYILHQPAILTQILDK
jgi:hypothetical protein